MSHRKILNILETLLPIGPFGSSNFTMPWHPHHCVLRQHKVLLLLLLLFSHTAPCSFLTTLLRAIISTFSLLKATLAVLLTVCSTGASFFKLSTFFSPNSTQFEDDTPHLLWYLMHHHTSFRAPIPKFIESKSLTLFEICIILRYHNIWTCTIFFFSSYYICISMNIESLENHMRYTQNLLFNKIGQKSWDWWLFWWIVGIDDWFGMVLLQVIFKKPFDIFHYLLFFGWTSFVIGLWTHSCDILNIIILLLWMINALDTSLLN